MKWMGHVTHGKNEMRATFWLRCLKLRGHTGNLIINERVILKRILEK